MQFSSVKRSIPTFSTLLWNIFLAIFESLKQLTHVLYPFQVNMYWANFYPIELNPGLYSAASQPATSSSSVPLHPGTPTPSSQQLQALSLPSRAETLAWVHVSRSYPAPILSVSCDEQDASTVSGEGGHFRETRQLDLNNRG